MGANYYDLFLRLVAHPGNDTTLKGLEKLAKAGVPFVRFSAGGYSAKDWERVLQSRESHFAALDRVVRRAEELHIGLIPSLYWTLNLAWAVGEPIDQWGNPESKTIDAMRSYTAAVVERYKGSPAIWAWEFGNEINLRVDLPNAAQIRAPKATERDDLSSAAMGCALTEFAKEVHKHDGTRAIISGNSHPRSAAWHNTAERNWKNDTQAQWREILLRDNPAPLNTLGIHIYADSEAKKVGGTWAADWKEYMRVLNGVAKETGRPVFVGEFGLSSKGRSPEEVRQRFEAVLDAMESTETGLAAFWVFDLASQDNDWNINFGNERAYMLELAVAANKRWESSKDRRSH